MTKKEWLLLTKKSILSQYLYTSLRKNNMDDFISSHIMEEIIESMEFDFYCKNFLGGYDLSSFESNLQNYNDFQTEKQFLLKLTKLF